MRQWWFWLTLFEGGCRFFSWIPWSVKGPGAKLAAHIVFKLSARLRKATTANMAIMLNLQPGDPAVKNAARRSVENYLLQALMMGDAYLAPPEELRRKVSFWSPRTREHSTNLLRDGRVIFATCHFGTWDAAASWAATLADVYVVQQNFSAPGLTEVFRRLREHLGMKSLDMRRDIREMFRILRRNGHLAILVDRPLIDGGGPVNWFGRLTKIPAGVAKLALRTDATILPIVVYRGQSGMAILRVADPIRPDRSAPPDREIARLLQQTSTSLEMLIAPAPDQWYQFRNFWPAR